MIGGVDPILIFTFKSTDAQEQAKDSLAGIPKADPPILTGIAGVVGKYFSPLTEGLPIPIYLSENITQIVVQSENIEIGVDNNVQGSASNKLAIVDQKAVDSSIRIEMSSTRSSLFLASLIALSDLAFSRLNSKTYNISYINGTTIVIGALLKSFSARQTSENNLVEVYLELSKKPKETSNVTEVPNKTTVASALPSTGLVV